MLVTSSIEDQAKYADHTIAHYVSLGKNAFIDDQIAMALEMGDKKYAKWNASSIGGLAYIAVYYVDREVAQQARNILNEYIQWYDSTYGCQYRHSSL